jgi:hypothetical protein
MKKEQFNYSLLFLFVYLQLTMNAGEVTINDFSKFRKTGTLPPIQNNKSPYISPGKGIKDRTWASDMKSTQMRSVSKHIKYTLSKFQ